jgi:coniferyl-aldehyde dehydrogenase
VRPYRGFAEALTYINERPRPLALYYFDLDRERQRTVLARTTSGGVSINDTLLQYLQEDLPFGGIGSSGMGAYHGREGFLLFSHCKAVFEQSRVNLADLLRPPYRKRVAALVGALMR